MSEINIKQVENFNITSDANHIMGRTEPGNTEWEFVKGPSKEMSGLMVKINLVEYGFKDPPFIIPQLHGAVDNWVMLVSVGYVTKEFAVIFIRSTVKGYNPTVKEANSKQWHLQYQVQPWMKNHKWPPLPKPIDFDNIQPRRGIPVFLPKCDNA
jgi:hypothetical protein